MKLLIDVRKLSYKPSGIGIYIYRYILGLYQYSNIEIILVTDVEESDEIKELKEKGIKIYCFEKKVDYSYSLFSYVRYIKKVIKDICPDIFWEPNNIIPTKIKNKSGIVLLTVHDLFPITCPQYHRLLFRIYYKFMMRKSLQCADVITSVSDYTLQELRKRYEKLIRNKKTFVSYNIVDLEYKESKIDNGYFLYIGNIEMRKGVDILLDSFCKYKKNGGKYGLYIAGGIRDKKLEEIIKDMAVQYNDFKYFGYVTNEEKQKLIEQCTCFVFPSRAEGFGIPPLEALACGKDVIVSSLDVFYEILDNEVSYFNIMEEKLEESINSLTQSMFKYKRENNNVIALMKKYSMQTVINNFVINIR